MTTYDELVEFVRQSNAIEGVYAAPGEPLFDDHLMAARTLTGGMLLDPLSLHRLLMRSEPHTFPGQLRQLRVSVGGRECPSPTMVPTLYRELMMRVTPFVTEWTALVADELAEEVTQRCWNFHHELEWIHPFVDGNGRTGRLWLNSLRLSVSLPWLTVYEQDRQTYYQQIKDWIAANRS